MVTQGNLITSGEGDVDDTDDVVDELTDELTSPPP